MGITEAKSDKRIVFLWAESDQINKINANLLDAAFLNNQLMELSSNK